MHICKYLDCQKTVNKLSVPEDIRSEPLIALFKISLTTYFLDWHLTTVKTLILAFLFAKLLVIHFNLLNIEYLQPVIVANLLRLQNSRNKEHVKI